MSRTKDQLQVHFEIDGADARLAVASASGQEAVSSLFCFDVRFAVSAGSLSPEAVVGSNACLTVDHGKSTMRRRGIISEIEYGEIAADGTSRYQVTLAPQHWTLCMNRRSRLLHGLSVAQILEQYLVAEAGLRVRFELQRTYAKRETVAQYQESDLDFVSRLIEHEGISYFYEHGADESVLVVTDDTTALDLASYRVAVGCDGPAAVQGLRCRRRQVPRRVVLRDYNERIPHVPLQGEAEIDPRGCGTVAEHGAGFRTPEEAAAIAAIRAQEQRCRGSEFEGRLSSCAAAPGAALYVAGHTQFVKPILIVSIRHNLTRDSDGAWHQVCEFTGQPAALPYRPSRVTPVPKVHGTMSAHAVGRDGRAEMDDHGRYRVRLPFEMDPQHGDTSGFLRMAQPSAGTDQGIHFPLEPGSEVLWSCIGGDPDRPVITAVVPNSAGSSVLASDNQDRSIIRAAGGAMLEFGGPTSPAAEVAHQAVVAPLESGSFQEQRHQAAIDASGLGGPTGSDQDTGAGRDKWFKVKVPDFRITADKDKIDELTQKIADEQAKPSADQDQAGISTWTADRGNLQNKTYSDDCYLRMGTADKTEPPEAWFFQTADPYQVTAAHKRKYGRALGVDECDGVFDYTDGYRVQVTRKKRETYVEEEDKLRLGKPFGSTALEQWTRQIDSTNDWWRTTTMAHSSSDSYSYGDSESFHAGFGLSGKIGLDTSISIGGSLSLSAAASVSVSLSLSTSYTAGISYSSSDGGSVVTSPSTESSADISNKINVKPGLATAFNKKKMIGGAAIASLIATVPTLALAIDNLGETEEDPAETWGGLGTAIGVSGAYVIGTSAWTLAQYALHKASPAVASEIALSQFGIKMGMGVVYEPGISIAPSGITLSCGPSRITLSQSGVTIVAPQIKLNGSSTVAVTTPGAGLKLVSAMATLSGANTKIEGKANMMLETKMGLRGGTWADG